MTETNWRIKGYQWTERAILRTLDVAQTVHQGLWLGLLDREGLNEIGANQYLRWKPLYGNRDYNLSGLLAWEATALDRFFSGCESVLLGGAGGGREMIALSRRGLRVDAFECCQDFVELCQNLLITEGINSRVVVAPPDEVPGEFGIYDGLVMGWGSYMHINGCNRRVGFLRKFRRHIRTAGPILISFLTRKASSRKANSVFHIARSVQHLCGKHSDVEVGDSLHGSFAHYFTYEEIQYELQQGGFQMEYYSEQPYGHAVGRAV